MHQGAALVEAMDTPGVGTEEASFERVLKHPRFFTGRTASTPIGERDDDERIPIAVVSCPLHACKYPQRTVGRVLATERACFVTVRRLGRFGFRRRLTVHSHNHKFWPLEREMRLNIQRWDPATMMKPHRKCVYIGRSGGGKSCAMRAVLRSMPAVDLAIGFTPTDETYEELAKIIPSRMIYRDLDLDVITRALDLQKELADKNRSLALIADDCAYDKGVWRTSSIRSLFMNARHHRVSLHLSMQYLMDMDPSLRTNCDYVICTAENIHTNKRKLWQSFFGVFKSYQHFDAVFSQLTSDYSCIVLDQTQPSASVSNSIFWYKADLKAQAAPFRLCKSVFWHFQERPPEKKKADVMIIEDKETPRRVLVDAI